MQISDLVKEQQGVYTYLTYEIKTEDNVDSMGIGMMINNQIEGFVPVVYTQMNDKSYLKYILPHDQMVYVLNHDLKRLPQPILH